MKRYNITAIFILTAVVLGTPACNDKNHSLTPNHDNIDISDVAYSRSTSTRILSDIQVDSIALMHNLYMTQVINNFDFSNVNYESEMYSNFEVIGSNDFGMTLEDITIYLDSSNNDNYNFVKLNTDDPDVIGVFDNVQEYLSNNPDCNFSDIQNLVSTQTAFASESITGSDLDIALTFLKTFEKSSYLWMPASKGGSGIGSSFIDDFEEEVPLPSLAIKWKAIAYADGAGAAGVLLRTWYLAGFGPMSWGTILGAIGWGAAWASGASLLYQFM